MDLDSLNAGQNTANMMMEPKTCNLAFSKMTIGSKRDGETKLTQI